MAKDTRDLLGVLKGELKFIESGGYRKAPYFPPLMFEDSPTCLNHDRPHFPRPCTECVMMQLVPPGYHGAEVPCRHIPLNAMGETVDTLYDRATEREIEIAVTKWLKGIIQKLETEKSAGTLAKDKIAPVDPNRRSA